MASEFSREFFSANRIVKADLHCARQPREQDLDKIKAELKSLYDATEVLLDVSVDESLLSGYVLQVGDRVFDNSGRHALDQMTGDKPDLATLKTRVEDYKPAANTAEGGTVVSAADGIVTVEGMDRAVYGEIVTFENGAKGMVESVEPSHLGIMLFDGAESVGVGTLVTRTGKRAGIPVGEAFLGRVINPLGEPIDGKGAIEAVGYNPIEKQAPGILERQSVDTPLHTGILSIDSMFPIGRGQRELIIGDRQTGKTSIATDTILNQKDTGVLCIYVAIGQKASSIARVAEDLKKHGAMGYTTIVAATASDSAPLQYIAPYAGTALAFPSTPWHTVPFPCCCAAPPAVRLTPATFSTCIPVCWNVPAVCGTTWAAVPSPHCPLLKPRQAMFPPTFPPTLFPSPMARSSWRPHCSTQATARLSTLACRFPVSAALPRPRP